MPSKKIELTKNGYDTTDPESLWFDIVMYSYNKEEDYVWTPYGCYGLENNRNKLDWIFPLGVYLVNVVSKRGLLY